jgi:hypothetical protein
MKGHICASSPTTSPHRGHQRARRVAAVQLLQALLVGRADLEAVALEQLDLLGAPVAVLGVDLQPHRPAGAVTRR